MTNPFQIGKPSFGRNFVGREEEIDRAIDALKNGTSVSIIGPLGIGKTTFLHKLRNRLQSFDIIDLSGLSRRTKETLISAILQYLKVDVPEKPNLSNLEKAVQELKDTKIICLDEFDLVTDFSRDPFFYQFLKTLGQGKFTYLIASNNPLSDICPKGKGSPFDTIFLIIELGVFSDDEASRLISLGNFSDKEKKFIHKFAGNHPNLLQTLCYFVFEMKARLKRELNDDELQKVRKKFLRQVESFIKMQIDELLDEEIEEFNKFLKTGTFRKDMDSLVNRGLIISHKDEYSVLDLTKKYFIRRYGIRERLASIPDAEYVAYKDDKEIARADNARTLRERVIEKLGREPKKGEIRYFMKPREY